MSQVDTKTNDLALANKALEERVHALEIEKRADKIHAKNPKFDIKGKSIEYLDGVIEGMSFVAEPKAHNTAEIVPAANVQKGRKIGDPIDDDAEGIAEDSGSDP